MKKDKISFLIAAYNCQRVISLTVEHISDEMFDFSHLDFEIIIVDDCSTDQTLDKLNNLKKSFSSLKIFENKTNIGFASTIFKALNQSTGNYIKLMHCADYEGTNLKTFLFNYNKYDVLLCKIIDKRKFFRRYLSKFINMLFRLVAQKNISYFFSALLCKKDLFYKYFPQKNFGTFFIPIIVSKLLIENKNFIEIPISPKRGGGKLSSQVESRALNVNNFLSLGKALLNVLIFKLKN
jgi:glycosyltransferase involved in cell wall biosynthesis